MPRRAPKALLSVSAIAAAVALTLSGCSAKTDAPQEAEEGPLSKYLSALWDGEEYTDEKFQAEQLKTEELIAECMQSEGFDYEPDIQNVGSFMSNEDTDGPQWGTKDFAEQYGYGFINGPGMTESVESGEEYVDPNQEYIESLSASEQEAYYETLHGPQPTEEELAMMEEDEGYQPDISQQGCWGKAYHEINQSNNGYQAATEDPEFADLFEGINKVWDTSDNDEIQKLNTQWADCMSDSGYPEFKSPEDAQMSIMNAQNELYSGGQDPLSEDPAEYKEPDKKAIDALQKKEIEVATADFTCMEKIDFVEKSTKISHAIEQKFVDENKAQLDAMVAKYQVSSGTKSKEK